MNAGELTLPIRDAVPGASFDELMAAHQQRVLRTAYRLLGRVEDAQDASQEVFLRLLRNLDKIEGDPAAWLYRVTVNICNDQFRKKLKLVDAADLPLADGAPNPERALQVDQRKALLMAGLKYLTGRERTAVVLRDIEGLTTREVAGILGVEEVTVRTQLFSARVKLAKYVRGAT